MCKVTLDAISRTLALTGCEVTKIVKVVPAEAPRLVNTGGIDQVAGITGAGLHIRIATRIVSRCLGGLFGASVVVMLHNITHAVVKV